MKQRTCAERLAENLQSRLSDFDNYSKIIEADGPVEGVGEEYGADAEEAYERVSEYPLCVETDQ
jgi:hypothetical protein